MIMKTAPFIFKEKELKISQRVELLKYYVLARMSQRSWYFWHTARSVEIAQTVTIDIFFSYVFSFKIVFLFFFFWINSSYKDKKVWHSHCYPLMGKHIKLEMSNPTLRFFKTAEPHEIILTAWGTRNCRAFHCEGVTHTWPVSWATTKAEEKPSSWFKVQLLRGWHIPVTGA